MRKIKEQSGSLHPPPPNHPQRMRNPICPQKKTEKGIHAIFRNLELWGSKQLHWGESQGCFWNTMGSRRQASNPAAPSSPKHTENSGYSQGSQRTQMWVSDGGGRASSTVSCGMCLSVCVRCRVWVGVCECMRLQICQSAQSLCVS